MRKAVGAEFTKKMKRTHTIYIPDMLHYHNELLQAAFAYGGYRLAVVPEFQNAEQGALKYVSSDYCLPAIGIVGQILAFLNDSNCDADRIAIMEPQAGGACRAGNIYNLILEVLEKTGYEFVPVISLNMTGSEKHRGFSINAKLLRGCVAAVCYGDMLMTLTQQLRPYEEQPGQTEELRQRWLKRLAADIAQGKNITGRSRRRIYEEMAADFEKLPRQSRILTKVGITGEIYMKYSPVGNDHLEDFLKERDCDYRLGGFINYAAYVVYTEYSNVKLQEPGSPLLKGYEFVLDYICRVQRELTEVLSRHHLLHDACFFRLRDMAKQIIADQYNIGDGWLVAGEILDFIQQGYKKILIVHPFGCLVSHVGARGIIKKIKAMYPEVSIQSIEYDYDQSRTLRESRILLGI